MNVNIFYDQPGVFSSHKSPKELSPETMSSQFVGAICKIKPAKIFFNGSILKIFKRFVFLHLAAQQLQTKCAIIVSVVKASGWSPDLTCIVLFLQ